MVEQKIEFRKTRDLGQNLNDSFLFIGLNIKSLLKSFFAICAIFMLIQAILNGFFDSGYGMLWDAVYRRRIGSRYRNSYPDIGTIMLALSKWFTFTAVQVTVLAYIKSYIQNDGSTPTIEQVWAMFKRYFFRVLLLTFPVSLAILVGLVFCVIPGIYLWVVFLPFSAIAVMEDTSMADTFSRCFELVRDNFWSSFVVYVCVTIIYIISSFFFEFVISALMGLTNYFTTYKLSSTITMITSFFEIFSLCFYVVVMVSVALNYFNLAELRDGLGIIGRINKIGGIRPREDIDEELY